LVACWPFNEFAQYIPYDVISGSVGIVPVSTAAGDLFIPPGYKSAGSSQNNISVAIPTWLKIQPPITLIWLGRYLGTPSANNGSFFGVNYSNPGGAPFDCFNFQIDGSNTMQFYFNDSGTRRNLSITASFGTTRHLLGGVISPTKIDGSNYALSYLDGTAISGYSAASITAVNYSATSMMAMGYAGNCIHELACIYNRVLSVPELRWLQAEPYDLFEFPRRVRRLTIPAPVVPPPTQIPLPQAFW
jgi:hypothetical protein